MEISEKVEAYYEEEHHFKQGIAQLRALALKTGMEETFKWMFPTYTLNGKNVLAVCKFKKHFGIWFFNGVFLSDFKEVLENAQEGKTQAMRHWKFYTVPDIDKTAVLGYMNEAIENERKGLKLIPKKKVPVKVVVPKLLRAALEEHPRAQKSFLAMTPYKQKEYAEYIATAKQDKTKRTRLAKILPMITEGKGLNYLYQKKA